MNQVYSAKNRDVSTYKTYTNTILFLLIAAILLTLDRLGTVTFARKLAVPFEFGQIPVFIIKNNFKERFDFLINLAKIEKENAELSQKLAEVSAENAKLSNLAEENQALRVQLGFFGNQIKTIPAKVLGLSRFLVIIPDEARVKNGATVTLGNNFVGTVTEFGTKLAKVRLPQDPVSSIPAIVVTPQGKIYGNLVGTYGTTMVLEKVEKQEIVPMGAIVQTAGDENTLPGLVLGKVVKVEKVDPDPFLNVEVESLVNFSKLTTVFVLL